MFENGSVLWIPNYLLPNGKKHPKGKFLIILFSDEAETVVMSLATSRDNVPKYLEGKRYYNDEENGISFYFFPEGETITDKEFKFDCNTYVYFHGNIKKIKTEKINSQNQHIIEKGILIDNEYRDILYAALKSQYISEKYIPEIEKILEQLF